MAIADKAPAPKPKAAASRCSCAILGRNTASTPRKPNATATIRTGSRCVTPQHRIQQAMTKGAVSLRLIAVGSGRWEMAQKHSKMELTPDRLRQICSFQIFGTTLKYV